MPRNPNPIPTEWTWYTPTTAAETLITQEDTLWSTAIVERYRRQLAELAEIPQERTHSTPSNTTPPTEKETSKVEKFIVKPREEWDFLDVRDVDLRFTGVICRVKDSFYYARGPLEDVNTTDGPYVFLENLVNAEMIRVPANWIEIEYNNSHLLGYCNYGNSGAIYFSRTPVRRNKIGISSSNVVYSHINRFNQNATTSSDLLKSSYALSMYENKYPTYVEAKKLYTSLFSVTDYPSVALSRKFALSVKRELVGDRVKALQFTNLYYEGTLVGELDVVANIVKLLPEYAHSIYFAKVEEHFKNEVRLNYE